MHQHSVVDDLAFDISVDLGATFDELDRNQGTSFLVSAQASCSKITRAQVFNLRTAPQSRHVHKENGFSMHRLHVHAHTSRC